MGESRLPGDASKARGDEAVRSPSGIPLSPSYAPDPKPPGWDARVGEPGAPPYVRGVQPTMYRGRLWTMRQYAGFSTAEESNRRYRALLAGGTSGLSVAFDLPTQIGYDPDHALAVGEVGRAGVSIATLSDLETLFDGIPLDRVSVSMTINSTAIVLLAMTIACAKRRGVSEDALSGTLQNDILKEFAARGTQRLPVRPSMRLVTDVIAYAADRMPKWNPVSVSGYHVREAGATAVQEVAFTLADGVAYVEAAVKRGLAVDRFAPRVSFFFNAHNDLFEEVAKFRAARRIWSRTLAERFGAKDPKSLALRFHAQTAGSTLQARQVDVNVVRVTIQALAAVLGGTQSLHTNGKDEALALPSEEAAILALRTQQVIAHESGVANVVDPLGGSPYVEALTDEIDRRASDLMARVDAMGGAVAAIEQGFFQREIERSAYEALKRVESGADVVVGVNRYASGDDAPPRTFAIDPATEARAVERVRAHRAKRDGAATRAALQALSRALAGDENLVPIVVAAVEAGATVGEVLQAMEDRFGNAIGG
jgi:methylmalonyl-CoA mutase N-terminal domain/subunit